MFFARRFPVLAFLGAVAALGTGTGDALAQQIYRITGPDGRITFSDKPPLETTAKVTTAAAVALPSGSSVENLPFELRQAATRYPVTLYTGPGCGPCMSGRTLLSSRGVPFTEKTVSSNEDIDALKRMAGAPTLPFMTIGAQQLRGYSEVEWSQFLDAAGYPKTSLLPTTYTSPPPTPLVAAQEPDRQPRRPAPVAERTPEAPAAGVPLEPPTNPSGIRF
jgi:glutaredoxin